MSSSGVLRRTLSTGDVWPVRLCGREQQLQDACPAHRGPELGAPGKGCSKSGPQERLPWGHRRPPRAPRSSHGSRPQLLGLTGAEAQCSHRQLRSEVAVTGRQGPGSPEGEQLAQITNSGLFSAEVTEPHPTPSSRLLLLPSPSQALGGEPGQDGGPTQHSPHTPTAPGSQASSRREPHGDWEDGILTQL